MFVVILVSEVCLFLVEDERMLENSQFVIE